MDDKSKSLISYLYTPEELKELQNFDQEHRQVNKGTHYTNILRCILMCMNACILTLNLMLYGWNPFFKYLTNWTLVICTYSVYLSYQVGGNPESKKDKSLMSRHHFFYTLSIVLNTVTVGVYWNIIYPY